MAINNKLPNIDSLSPTTIAGRFGTSKYFSSNQTLIFVGPYLIDEALACSYKIEQRKVPIYGYASQYYDALASGKVIVTGSITVNYIDSGYMSLALSGNLLAAQGVGMNAVTQAISGANKIGQDIIKKLNGLPKAGEYNNKDSINTAGMRQIAQMIATNPQEGQDIMKQLRQKYWGAAIQSQDKRGFTSNYSVEQLKSFNEARNDGANFGALTTSRPDQLPSVNITVSHGNPLQSHQNSTFRVLREVEFISQEMSMSPTGQTQTETYVFIARSIE